jgi:hypothetical protein
LAIHEREQSSSNFSVVYKRMAFRRSKMANGKKVQRKGKLKATGTAQKDGEIVKVAILHS